MKHFILLFFILFSSKIIQAQIVNIEDKRSKHADTTGVFGRLDVGFNLVENGSTILNLKGAAQVEVQRNKHLWLYIPNFSFIKVEDDHFVNQGFQHLRYNFHIKDALTYEAFAQWQYNERVRIKVRWLGGTGMRFNFLKKEKQKIYLGLAYMYEYNEMKDTTIIHRDHRLSSYFSFKISPFKYLTLSGTTYLQPILKDFSNMRVSTKNRATFKLSEKLSFTVTFSLTHDARLKEDATDVPDSIYSLVNGLRWVF